MVSVVLVWEGGVCVVGCVVLVWDVGCLCGGLCDVSMGCGMFVWWGV